MNPDFAIILNFKLASSSNDVADKLVKTARDIGVRAISGDKFLRPACEKYTIKLVSEQASDTEINSENIIDKLVNNRKQNLVTVIDITPDKNGNFTEDDAKLLHKINDWMHMFGHAFNEAEESNLTVNTDGFILKNRHATYQKYLFMKSPLPEKVEVKGLSEEPNRIEWIEDRRELDFKFKNKVLTINLTDLPNNFEWQIIRIQAHRPEDDLEDTKF